MGRAADDRPFDYATLADARDRQWLRDRTRELTDRLGQTAASIIDAGRILCEVKSRLGHGNFRRWLATEFPGSKNTAQRRMSAWKMVSNVPCGGTFDAEVVAYLVLPHVPAAARKHAVELAANGEPVSLDRARQIVGGFSARKPKGKAARTKPWRDDPPPPKGSPSDRRTLELLGSLIQRGEVRFSFTGGGDDEEGRSKGAKRTEVIRCEVVGPGSRDLAASSAEAPTVDELVRVMTGQVEGQVCRACKEPKPLTAFAISRGRSGGRETACKACESERFREGQKRRKAANKKAG